MIGQKRVIFLVVAAMLTAMVGLQQSVHATNDSDDRFVGTWKLVSYHSYPTDADPIERKMTGRINYDATGNMAAQLMPTRDTEERVTPGYVAYFGKFAVDNEAGTVTHSVAGSNVSRWVNTDLVRHFEFADGHLTLSLKEEGRVTGALVWKRDE